MLLFSQGIEEALSLKERLLASMLEGESRLAELKASEDEQRMQTALKRMQEQVKLFLTGLM